MIIKCRLWITLLSNLCYSSHWKKLFLKETVKKWIRYECEIKKPTKKIKSKKKTIISTNLSKLKKSMKSFKKLIESTSQGLYDIIKNNILYY